MNKTDPGHTLQEQLRKKRQELINQLAELDARIVEAELSAEGGKEHDAIPGKAYYQELRERAENLLSLKEQEDTDNEGHDEMLHNYEVQQIELELQNEALQGSQEELTETLHRYYNLFDSSPLGYLITDMVGKIHESNKAARKLLEMDESQRKQTIFSTYVAKKSLDLYYTLFNRLHNAPVMQEGELYLITAVGNEVLARAKFSVLIDGDKNHRRYLIIIENLNKQHELALMLERTEQKFEYIYKYAPIGIALINKNKEILQANAFFCQLTGYSENDLFGKTVKQITHPDDYEREVKNVRCAIEERRDIARLEKRYIRKDGGIVWVSLTTKVVFNDDGDWMFGLGLVEDITERKQTEAALQASEARFRMLAENSHDTIIMLDGVVMKYISPAFEYMLGYSPEDFQGESVIKRNEIIYEKDRHVILQQIKEAIEKRREYATYTYRMVRADKKVIWVETVVRSSFSEDGELLESIMNMRDITERKRVEEELQKSELDLREANAAKDKLFSIIGHDLKNPISSINMLTDVLTRSIEKGYNEKKFGEYVDNIRTSASNANTLLEDLLNWARFQQGRYVVKKDPILLGYFIGRVVEQFKTSAEEKEITLRSAADPNLNALGDAFMLSTILRNLIGNAIKFTNKGGAIDVVVEADKTCATIAVKDNGVGISEENQAKLFRIDTMHSTRGTANEEGTGFGLILCDEFAAQMGSGLSVESEEGKGSTFSFTLPVTVNGCPEKQ